MNLDEAENELQSVGDFVRWGASLFTKSVLYYGHGTDNALDEAFLLVRYALHLPHDFPPYMINARLTKSERHQVVELLAERVQSRKPAPYLINEAWFAGMPFYVDERVLIPRSPIAELIENEFDPWIISEHVTSVLDLCTGSGCIAIACASTFPEARVVATDLSSDAIDVARINVNKHGLESRMEVKQSDLFKNLDPAVKFDIIVSNPPYVDADDMAALDEEFKHEPTFALAAGTDGLDIVRRILTGAADYLNDGGILVVEVGNSADALIEAYPEISFIWAEFDRGGEGVFVLSKLDLVQHADCIRERN